MATDRLHVFWRPDTYITNAKMIEVPSKVLKLSKMKITWKSKKCTMTHIAKLVAIVSCQMELRNYPLDRQTCWVYFRSCKLM